MVLPMSQTQTLLHMLRVYTLVIYYTELQATNMVHVN